MEPLGALSGGAGGMADAVAGIIEQRLNQARLAETVRSNQATEAYRQQQLAETSAQRQATTAENVRYHDQLNQDRMSREGTALNESMMPGTDFSPASPMAPYLSSVPKMVQAPAPPESLAADPTQQGPVDLPGTIATSPSPTLGRLLTKMPTFKQADTTEKAALAQEKAATAQQAVDDRTAAAATNADLRGRAITAEINAAAAKRDAAGQKPIPVKTVDENGRSVIKYLTPDEVRGQTFKAQPNATTANRLDSAEAVSQTGNDLVSKLSDPTFAAKIGPALGRYNTLKDFIGNPPPEFSQLAGEIESYALANMGVHGMRSVQGANQIQELLNKRHSPESMIAAIKGLQQFSNNFMQSQGRTVPGVTPPAAGGASASTPGKSGVTASGIPWSKE